MCPDFVITSFIEMPDSIIGRTETDSRADSTQNSGFTCKVLTINGQVSICRTGYHFLPHKLQHIMRSQLPNESNYFNMQQFMICFGLLGKIKITIIVVCYCTLIPTFFPYRTIRFFRIVASFY